MEPSGQHRKRKDSEAEDPGPSSRSHLSTNSEPENSPEATNGQGGGSLLQMLGGLFRANTPALPEGKRPVGLKDALDSLLEEHEIDEDNAVITHEERELLRNILLFKDTTVEDIMIPRADIVAVGDDVSLEEIKAAFVEHHHTRMPVYHETLDSIIGYLHLKDIATYVFTGRANYEMRDALHEILAVPPSMKVIELLLTMRQNSQHIAIVVDEYGGTDGLVSMEDIMEVIVGEIQDEHDEEEDNSDFTWIDADTLDADARMEIESLEAALGLTLMLHEDEDEFDTLAGLIFTHLGRVPEPGESFDYPGGLRFMVLDADARSIKRVRVSRIRNAEPIAEPSRAQ